MTERLQKQPLPFLKMHGAGNDFVIIDARGGTDPVTPALARAVGDRHRGVGFDQLAVIHTDPEADARLMFWNSDGSVAGACGNATRCVARLLMDETGSADLVLRTDHGQLQCRADGDLVRVNMGLPFVEWAQIPLARDVDTLHLPLEGDPAACSMGNPHCSYFVDDAQRADVSSIGYRTEHDPLFPERTNVQIVQVLDRGRARVRVWERGVGPTLASGSSACAVVVNASRRGLMDRRADILLDGGTLSIDWRDDGVWMTGPTAKVFEGVLDPSLLP